MKTVSRIGPLLTSQYFPHTKDPCPVFDGKKWQIFGTGHHGAGTERFLLHATASEITGPWKEKAPLEPTLEGDCVAAPGVIYDKSDKVFHMFIQTNCYSLNGTIEHLVSKDGNTFKHIGTILRSIPGSQEAGIYDPHPSIIGGEKYLVYSGMPKTGRGDIYLAKSTSHSWYGPWEGRGKILTHEEVDHHNQHGHLDYEWGLEGAQLIELPNGKILLNAVCFLPDGKKGERQRIFFALADNVAGPYKTLGPIFDPKLDKDWGDGENGHAAGFIDGDLLQLVYQAKGPGPEIQSPWKYGLATIPLKNIH